MEKAFITGGTGYLGRALVATLIEHPDSPFITVYSRDEAKLAKLKRKYPQILTIVGDVTEPDGLARSMADHDTVIHCAAMKFIPECERQPVEATRVNLFGSQLVAATAIHLGVKDVVGISTDKACEPVNAYGATKMLMERQWMEYNSWPGTDFHLVRYGNVMASTGSVVEVWKHQIQKEGKIRITDPLMTRFWFSVEDAVQLVLRSLEEPGGTILVPLIGSSFMGQLAEACWSLFAGPELGEWNQDRCSVVVGNRGGEKSHELLISELEARSAIQTKPFDPSGHIPLSRLFDPEVKPMEYGEAYTSTTPRHWLTNDELCELIQGAMKWE